MAEHALITGGAGFVGAHLARRLLAEGTEVTLLDDLSRGRQDRVLTALERDARLVRHDLTQPVPASLLPSRVDTVYHLAAVVGVQRTADMPGQLLRTNILATVNLLDWCDRTGPDTVFLSSTSEFSDGAARLAVAPFPTPEDAPFVLAEPRSTRSSYALSKAVCESMLLYRAERYRVRVGRYFNVYGTRMGNSHVIPQFIGRILHGDNPFRVHGAHQSRAFCHVDDALTATVGLTKLSDRAPVVANIGDDTREITMIDLAHLLFGIADVHPDIDVHPPPANSPDRRLPDLTVLRQLLPAYERVPLETGLRHMYAWYAEEPA